jgi:arylamine N-acetyltransferase
MKDSECNLPRRSWSLKPMSTLSHRPAYTKPQLSQWLSLINQSKSSLSLEDLEADIKQEPLQTLRKLQLWQLAAVPFGNLVLHYSPHHAVSLDPYTLFTKIVERKMGGYCMENNAFFATVLRSLGYNLYTTGARVSSGLEATHKDPGGYSGWSHMLLIVNIRGQKYAVDVGFGSSGPTEPILLKDGERVGTVPTSEGRLSYQSIAPFTDSSQKLWVFEVRNSPDSPWFSQYCFPEIEFLPEDYSVMNYSTSQGRTSWFTQRIVLTRIILDENQEKPIGNLTLASAELKRRLHAESETLVLCKTEQERVEMLNKYFGVQLQPDEVRGIEGLPSEIK